MFGSCDTLVKVELLQITLRLVFKVAVLYFQWAFASSFFFTPLDGIVAENTLTNLSIRCISKCLCNGNQLSTVSNLP